jgi:hypothetical protein
VVSSKLIIMEGHNNWRRWPMEKVACVEANFYELMNELNALGLAFNSSFYSHYFYVNYRSQK